MTKGPTQASRNMESNTHMVHSLSYNRSWPRTASRTYMMTVVWLARVPSSDTESDVSSVVAQRGAREVNVDGLLVAPGEGSRPAELVSSALEGDVAAGKDGR